MLTKYRAYLLLERGLSDNTRDAYSHDVERFLDFLREEQLPPEAVQLDDLHRFTWTLHDIGISPRSIARILAGIRSFYRFLLIDGYIDHDPTTLLESPKIGQHLPEVLSLQEIDAIIAAIDLSQPEGQRDRTIIEMLYSCGLRVSELCNLRLSDLYLEEEFLRVMGKGNKQRLVPISPRAINELRLWMIERATIDILPGEDDYVFVSHRRRKHLSRITVFRNIRQYAEAAGIHRTISPHTFRHSFATHLLEGGANLRAIQAMLGHESIATTEIYTHIDRKFLRQQIIEHFPRNKKDAENPGGETTPENTPGQ